MWTEDRAPNVVLLRDPASFTTGALLERGLEEVCNLKTIPIGFPRPFHVVQGVPRAVRQRFLDALFRAQIAADIPFRRKVDLLVVVDPVRLGFVPEGLADSTAYYAIDSHVNFEAHRDVARVADYDTVLVAQKDHLARYTGIGCPRVAWLPLAFDPGVLSKLSLPRTRDLTFVGGLRALTDPWAAEKGFTRFVQERHDAIEAMKARAGLEVHSAFLHEMARIYSESKIVFNRSFMGDVNMRIFEAVGCGAFLLTDRLANGLPELFTDRVHLRTYADVDEAVDLAKYYLEHDDEREAIGLTGYRHALAHHTYTHRAAELLRQCLGFVPPPEA